MTYERALKELKRQVQYWKNGIPFAYKLQPLEFAVSALEKQIPMKPDYPLKERKCAKCGKTFIPPYHHVFQEKKRGKWYCSWTCWNHRKDKGGGADERHRMVESDRQAESDDRCEDC